VSHDRPDAHRLEPGQRLAGLRPDDVGQSDSTHRLSVGEHVRDRLPLFGEPGDARVRDSQAMLLEEAGAHDLYRHAVHRSRGALPRKGGESVGSRILHAALRRGPHDSGGDGVLGAALERGGEAQDVVLGAPVERHDVGNAEATFGEGAGLVEHDCLQLARPFETPSGRGSVDRFAPKARWIPRLRAAPRVRGRAGR